MTCSFQLCYWKLVYESLKCVKHKILPKCMTLRNLPSDSDRRLCDVTRGSISQFHPCDGQTPREGQPKVVQATHKQQPSRSAKKMVSVITTFEKLMVLYRVVSVRCYTRSDILWLSFAFVCVRLYLHSFAYSKY